jgi:hypothetical protein
MNTKNEYTIALKNKRVWDFYDTHPNVNFESANLLLVDFMETIFNNMTNDISSNINTQLLSFMKENQSRIDNISECVNAVNQNVNTLSVDLNNHVMVQMNNIKAEYIRELTGIINTSSLTSNEKISSLIDKSNNVLVDKTTLLLNDIIPKSNSAVHSLIKENMKDLHDTITSDTQKLTAHINSQDAQTVFLSTIENKLSSLIQNIQLPLYSTLNASEERMTTNINIIKETTNNSVVAQNKLFGELGGFLDKYKNSSYKGKLGEGVLLSVLQSIYSSAEITNTTGSKASGDFIMKRSDKPDIMIENKEYSDNIPKEEVSKFIRDIDTLNMSGIFISQHSGIAFKQNFQIDINKGNVLVYIQNCQYNAEHIRIAVDIIDNLSPKLNDFYTDDENCSISKDILDDINVDYRSFITQKESLQTVLRDFTKRMNALIEELALPSLDRYLEPKYAYVKDRLFKCDLCNDFNGKSKQALSAHKRGCKKKQTQNTSIANGEDCVLAV